MTSLSVNLNRVALLRNTRNVGLPDLLKAARIVIGAGAAGITVHPRPDERHIRRSDVLDLAALLKSHGGVEFNIEGYPDARYMDIVRAVLPTQATLVPDEPWQATSDHGWDLPRDSAKLSPVVAELRGLGIRVSLFMDPVAESIRQAGRVGPDRVELYTEAYARAFAAGDFEQVLEGYARAAQCAQEIGLGVNAGHDLNLANLAKFCSIGGILEVSIGHALIAEALEMGLEATVKAYLRILS